MTSTTISHGRIQQNQPKSCVKLHKRRESGSPDEAHPVRAQPTTPTANERNPRATEEKVLCKFLEFYHLPNYAKMTSSLENHEPAKAGYAVVSRADPKFFSVRRPMEFFHACRKILGCRVAKKVAAKHEYAGVAGSRTEQDEIGSQSGIYDGESNTW